jgi:hypothetical protein
MPVRLMMWFCRVALRMLKALYCTRLDGSYFPDLEREYNDLMNELNGHLWPPNGKPPKEY